MSTTATPAPVNTAKVTDRRTLRFNTPEEMLADVDRIAAADRAGRLRRTGNWTAGQTFGHLAAWVDFAFDGHPLRPPWFIRLIMKRRRNKYLYDSLPNGVRIPGVEGGTLATGPLPLDEGLARLRTSWTRLSAESPAEPNVLFGPLTHQEWIQLNLRHAELHLSFLHPA